MSFERVAKLRFTTRKQIRALAPHAESERRINMKKFFKAISIVFAAALISQSLVWLASMAADSVPEAKASAKDEQIAVKEDRDEGIGFEKVSYWDTPLSRNLENHEVYSFEKHPISLPYRYSVQS